MISRWLAVAFTLVSVCGGGLCACGPNKPPPKTNDVDSAFEAAIAAEKDQDNAKGPTPSAPAPKPSSGARYPAPFTWEQIRAATKSGRTYRFRVEQPGKATKERVLTFTKVDDDGCELFSGNGDPKRVGWPLLQKDAEFPKDRVSTHEESVKLPGGKFDCVVYEVKGDDGEVSTYFFAKSLPGAPVLFYSEQDGKRLRTTTLLEHIQGRALLP
jgi:hypothetical protein